MDLLLQFIALLIAIASTAAIYVTILPIRDKVSCTTVMVVAMGIGTMNGLLIGTILALTQPFSLNCILSIIVGVSTGLILGVMFNYMTTIEGILGGLMGGLMGAMLGEMLTIEYIYIISLMLLVIMGLVTILLIKHIKQEVQPEHTDENFKNINFNKLTLIVAFSSLLLFSGILVGSSSPSESDSHSEVSHDH